MDAAGTPTEGLKISVADGKEGVLVCLEGRLNIDSSPQFRDQLLAILLEQSPRNLTVDLAKVSYIDSSGIATLLQGLKIARQHRIGLHLTGLEGRLLHLFEATGVLGLFATDGVATSSVAEVF
jgi:anti-anti-sigma factor